MLNAVVNDAESAVSISPEPVQFGFSLLNEDPQTFARRARMTTRRGVVETPAFMPVGTQATVKTLHPREVWAAGARIVLANTYHLALRPGLETLVQAGGLHRFMGWPGPILTDSGGFQIFSLAANARVSERGVAFRSHIDGSAHHLEPESAVGLQLGWLGYCDGARSSGGTAGGAGNGARRDVPRPPLARPLHRGVFGPRRSARRRCALRHLSGRIDADLRRETRCAWRRRTWPASQSAASASASRNQ